MDDDTPIGERIAYWRTRRKTSQAVLAGQVERSESWLQKIEYGERAMDSIAMLEKLAHVLKVNVWDLKPKLGLPPNGDDAHTSGLRIDAIRDALFATSPRDTAPGGLAALRATAEQAHRLRTNGHYKPVAVVLPDLLVAARAATVQDNPAAWQLLARVYQVALDLVREIGERELALLIADRYVTAAHASGDTLLIATSARHLGFALLDAGMLATAGAVCSDAADAVAPTEQTPVEGWSVWGSLQLAEALVAAHAQDRAGTWRLLGQARVAGERVGPGRNDYWQSFGPANVGLHEVHFALQFDDPVEALRVADTVAVDELPVNSRKAAYCIDVAHAHSLRRSDNDAATVAWVQAAYRYAPDRARTQVLPRELVRVCLKRERRSRTPQLRTLAEQLGIPD